PVPRHRARRPACTRIPPASTTSRHSAGTGPPAWVRPTAFRPSRPDRATRSGHPPIRGRPGRCSVVVAETRPPPAPAPGGTGAHVHVAVPFLVLDAVRVAQRRRGPDRREDRVQ